MKIKSNPKTYKKGHINIICLIITMLIFLNTAACESRFKNYEINSYKDLNKALQEDYGCKVSEKKTKKDNTIQSLFSANIRSFNVDGKTINIYEFKNQKEAKFESSTISKDGYSIGNKKIIWEDTPNFFQKGNVIVCYIGNDVGLISHLAAILGYEITGYNVNSYNDFIVALRDRGYKFNETIINNDMSQSPFSVNGKSIDVEKKVVTVYDFEDDVKAKSETDSISKDGYTIKNKKYNWNDTPHFYRKGGIIVSYIGSDKQLLIDLAIIFDKSIKDLVTN